MLDRITNCKQDNSAMTNTFSRKNSKGQSEITVWNKQIPKCCCGGSVIQESFCRVSPWVSESLAKACTCCGTKCLMAKV